MAKKNTTKSVTDKPENKAVTEKPANKSIPENGNVDVIATDDKHMVKGQTYNVTNEMARILIGKGAAKLK